MTNATEPSQPEPPELSEDGLRMLSYTIAMMTSHVSQDDDDLSLFDWLNSERGWASYLGTLDELHLPTPVDKDEHLEFLGRLSQALSRAMKERRQ